MSPSRISVAIWFTHSYIPSFNKYLWNTHHELDIGHIVDLKMIKTVIKELGIKISGRI